MRVAVQFTAGAVAADGILAPEGFPRDLSRWTAVVVDVLRATSTLTAALANGARAVEPYPTPEAAIRRRSGAQDVVACGERRGEILPGFDLGNSPLEFTRERVEGRTLAFASTNGSPALLATARCGTRILGAFVNATAVLERVLAARPAHVLIACAGTDGQFALEDAAFAGWLTAGLTRRGARSKGAEARLALTLAPADAAEVRRTVEGSAQGRHLRRLSVEHAADVAFCAELDRLAVAFAI